VERMDRARRIGGLAWVAAGVVFQLWFLLTGRASPEPVAWALIAAVLALTAAVLAGSPVGVRVAGWVAAVLLAVEFGGAVADRFGAFGPPGGAMVSWGDWSAFLDYTARLLPWAAHPLVVLAAVAATVVEAGLAVWLLSGRQRRWAGKAAAGLLTIYLVAMAFTVGAAAVATYAVPLLIGGALLVSAAPVARKPKVAALAGAQSSPERSG
jgi:hypothetical protein